MIFVQGAPEPPLSILLTMACGFEFSTHALSCNAAYKLKVKSPPLPPPLASPFMIRYPKLIICCSKRFQNNFTITINILRSMISALRCLAQDCSSYRGYSLKCYCSDWVISKKINKRNHIVVIYLMSCGARHHFKLVC